MLVKRWPIIPDFLIENETRRPLLTRSGLTRHYHPSYKGVRKTAMERGMARSGGLVRLHGKGENADEVMRGLPGIS